MDLFADANQNDFWEVLADKAYWQVILAIITAFVVSFASHLFIQRRNRNKQILEAISDFRRYGYELQQALSNRYQSEIFTNFYNALFRLTQDKDYSDQLKIEVNKMPELSVAVSSAYGKVYKSISLIEQLLPEKGIEEARSYLDAILHHRTYMIPDADRLTRVEEVTKYRDEWTSKLAIMIARHTRDNVNEAYKKLLVINSKRRSSLFLKLLIG